MVEDLAKNWRSSATLYKIRPTNTKQIKTQKNESGGARTAIARSENELSVVPLSAFYRLFSTANRQEGGVDRDRRIDADQRPQSELGLRPTSKSRVSTKINGG